MTVETVIVIIEYIEKVLLLTEEIEGNRVTILKEILFSHSTNAEERRGL
jgi:hypothetical protein